MQGIMGINIFFLARKQRSPARKLVSHKSARISSLCPGRVLIPLFGPPSIAFILETMLSGPPTHFLTDFPFNVSFYFFSPQFIRNPETISSISFGRVFPAAPQAYVPHPFPEIVIINVPNVPGRTVYYHENSSNSHFILYKESEIGGSAID
jgi:hypothetical protein